MENSQIIQVRNINFCTNFVENKDARKHFLIVGTTGSGKTLVIRMMLNSILYNLMVAPDYRAVIYDEKQNMVSIIKANEVPDENILIMNPFDSRCVSWDIAKDVTGPDTSFQIASILIPEEEGSQNRFFTDAGRDLLSGVMNVFIEKGYDKEQKTGIKRDWRLSDVLYTMQRKERIAEVLSQTDEGKDLIDLYLNTERTTDNILSTIRTRLAPLQVPIALWRHAEEKGRKISLREFLGGRYVLVLGNNQKARVPLQALNRIIFQRLTELLLDQPDDPKHYTWFILDELRKIGKLTGLDDLMNNGRSKGACVALAFQDIDGLRAVYGKEVAGEITAMCENICFMRLGGTETPRWASDFVGEKEEIVGLGSRGHSMGPSGPNYDDRTGEHIHRAPLLLPSEFTSLLPASMTTGVESFVRIPSHGPHFQNKRGKNAVSSQEIAVEMEPNPLDGREDFVPWQEIEVPEFKKIKGWQPEDFKRLGIAPSQPSIAVEPTTTGKATTFIKPKVVKTPNDPFWGNSLERLERP
jgi:type IV secretory pathway TraG/TraD family ATPase VirD4